METAARKTRSQITPQSRVAEAAVVEGGALHGGRAWSLIRASRPLRRTAAAALYEHLTQLARRLSQRSDVERCRLRTNINGYAKKIEIHRNSVTLALKRLERVGLICRRSQRRIEIVTPRGLRLWHLITLRLPQAALAAPFWRPLQQALTTAFPGLNWTQRETVRAARYPAAVACRAWWKTPCNFDLSSSKTTAKENPIPAAIAWRVLPDALSVGEDLGDVTP